MVELLGLLAGDRAREARPDRVDEDQIGDVEQRLLVVDEPAGWDAVFAVLRDEPARRGLLLDPEQAGLRLGQAARGARRVLIAIGPEGGFSVDERERAVRGGMLPVGLGPLVLRTETAGLAALAIVLHVHGELG